MTRGGTRYASALGLAACLILAFLPFGCGGTSKVDVQHPSGGQGIPDATLAELKACVEQAQGRLKGTYAFAFDVRATADGRADRVKLKEASPDDGGMDACMISALEGMEVPPSVLATLLADAESKAEAALSGAREQVGVAVVLVGGAIAIVETLVIAGGATIVVGISISLVGEAVELYRKKKKDKRKDECAEMFAECKSRNYPCNAKEYLCRACLDDCIPRNTYKFDQCTECGFR